MTVSEAIAAAPNEPPKAPRFSPVEVTPGCYSLRTPVPYAVRIVNHYAIRTSVGVVMIDCGVNLPHTLPSIEAGLRAVGLAITDIRFILVTHSHSDHYGFAQSLRKLTGATLVMSTVEATNAQELYGPYSVRKAGIEAICGANGLPRAGVAMMHRFNRRCVSYGQPGPVDWRVEDGEAMHFGDWRFIAVWVPGHSLGCVAYYEPDRRLLISGDHLLAHITPHVGLELTYDVALADFVSSVRKVARLDVDLVLPGHGRPFRAVQRRVAEILAHHEERKDAALAAVGDETLTAYEVMPRLFAEKLTVEQTTLAFEETLAHLVHLSQIGRLERVEEGGFVRFARPRVARSPAGIS